MNYGPRLGRVELVFPDDPGPDFPYARYRDDPAGFALDKLGVEWTPAQRDIAESLLRPPYRTLVKASHNVGKTMVSAGVLLWWHLTRSPSIVVSTAPKLEQVRDLLWKEVRRQGRGLVPFAGPRSCRIDRAADDFAAGTTARDGVAFQGHHGPDMLFIFDEALGVDPEMWTVTETMFMPPGHAWLCIFNPTDSASAAYQAEMARDAEGRPLWHVIEMSALDHPNIAAERAGAAPPVPSAVRLDRLNDMLAEWCEPVAAVDREEGDVEWPPGSGTWLRPGPEAEARLLGRWPSQGNGVWSDAMWRAARDRAPELPHPGTGVLPCIGCDVARHGEDDTAIHVRWGDRSVHHESANGWRETRTAGRLTELAAEWAAAATARRPSTAARVRWEQIPIKVDDAPVGGGVVDILRERGGNVLPVNAGSAATDPERYPNKRSELWMDAARRARQGRIGLAGLPRRALARLQQQLMAPTWDLDSAGRRVVEKKEDTKEKIGRSPDDADALNLAYYEPPSRDAQALPGTRAGLAPRKGSRQEQRGLLGKQARPEGRR